jgi:hypothetical protein
MFLQIDPRTSGPGRIAVHEPDDCTRLHIESAGPDGVSLNDESIGDVLEQAGAGFPAGQPGQFRLRVDWLRTSAANPAAVGDGWADRFAAMLVHARRQGWLDDHNGTVGAHVRHRQPAPAKSAAASTIRPEWR